MHDTGPTGNGPVIILNTRTLKTKYKEDLKMAQANIRAMLKNQIENKALYINKATGDFIKTDKAEDMILKTYLTGIKSKLIDAKTANFDTFSKAYIGDKFILASEVLTVIESTLKGTEAEPEKEADSAEVT